MKNGTRIALGLAGGYLLGRYGKARWLMLLAAGAAATRSAGSKMQQSESSADLTKLAEQGREVAAAIVGSRMEGITQRIHDTTESLRQAVGGPAAPSEGEQGEEAGESAEGSSEGEQQPEGRAEEESAQPEEPEQAEGRAEEQGQPDGSGGEPEAEQKGGRAEQKAEHNDEQAEQKAEHNDEHAEQKAEQKGARQPAKKGGQQQATTSPGSRRPESRRRAVEPGAGRRRTGARSGQSQG